MGLAVPVLLLPPPRPCARRPGTDTWYRTGASTVGPGWRPRSVLKTLKVLACKETSLRPLTQRARRTACSYKHGSFQSLATALVCCPTKASGWIAVLAALQMASAGAGIQAT